MGGGEEAEGESGVAISRGFGPSLMEGSSRIVPDLMAVGS